MSESWYVSTLLSGIAGAIVAAIITLVFSFRIERKMFRVAEIRNELEKAYGPIYSLLSKPEEMIKINQTTEELRIRITTEEKKRIDEIMTTYPHMFPNKVVAYWRVNIRDMDPIEVTAAMLQPVDYAIPLKFKELVYAEYNNRLQEYYDLMGRGKEFRKLPKFLRI